MNGRYNTRSPAVKRLMREAQELSEPTDQYFAQPLDDNLFEWHFTIRGPADSDFQNGIYHGRIVLPVDYPMKPPSIIWLTPNGRFETNKKICLSISGHHPESWQPSWSIRTALLAIIGFMPTHPGGAIGSLDYTPDERKIMAKKTKDWKCATCGEVTGILLEPSKNSGGTSKEARELAAQINLQGEKPKCKEGECPVEQAKLAEMQATRASTTVTENVSQGHRGTVGQESATSTSNHNNAAAAAAALPPPLATPAFSPPMFGPPMAFPQFPQWSLGAGPFPMLPVGFPYMQFPGIPLLPPGQFPYPPSHYSSIPQPNWINPPAGMFPGSPAPPTPPPHSSSSVPPYSNAANSTNNSSSGNPSGNVTMATPNQPSVPKYTRTPMMCSDTTKTSTPSSSHDNGATTASPSLEQDGQSQEIRGDVFKELLTKVKRVGSDGSTSVQADTCSTMADQSTDVPTACSENEKSAEASGGCEDIGDQDRKESLTLRQKSSNRGTDSEMSQTLKNGKDVSASISEIGVSQTEDNSEVGVSPIEASEGDPYSLLDKGACSSTSELERWKQKMSASKGLRQRQSATANLPADLSEEVAADSERSEVSNSGQRIEAASGDTALRNRPRHGPSRFGRNTNFLNVQNEQAQAEGRSRGLTFYLIVFLLTSSVMIICNRLLQFLYY